MVVLGLRNPGEPALNVVFKWKKRTNQGCVFVLKYIFKLLCPQLACKLNILTHK